MSRGEVFADEAVFLVHVYVSPQNWSLITESVHKRRSAFYRAPGTVR